jgi:hypothetical protein
MGLGTLKRSVWFPWDLESNGSVASSDRVSPGIKEASDSGRIDSTVAPSVGTI